MANADGYVLPKPGIPKTLGILNVIFGVLLSLTGICLVGYMAVLPMIVQFAERAMKDAQAKVEAQQKAQLKSFDDREKAATTEEEKQAIHQQRDAIVAGMPPVVKFDMSAATDAIKDPVVMTYTFIQLGSGAILSLILLISGIGLIRLRPWGRSVSVAWASLQIAQLVILTAVGILYIQPIQAKVQEKMLAKMEADAKGANAGPAAGVAESVRMARALSSPGTTAIFAIGGMILGSIYPVVVLVLLNKAGARAALQGPKMGGASEF